MKSPPYIFSQLLLKWSLMRADNCRTEKAWRRRRLFLFIFQNHNIIILHLFIGIETDSVSFLHRLVVIWEREREKQREEKNVGRHSARSSHRGEESLAEESSSCSSLRNSLSGLLIYCLFGSVFVLIFLFYPSCCYDHEYEKFLVFCDLSPCCGICVCCWLSVVISVVGICCKARDFAGWDDESDGVALHYPWESWCKCRISWYMPLPLTHAYKISFDESVLFWKKKWKPGILLLWVCYEMKICAL